MPAQNLSRTHADGTYCHVYNQGIEHKIIFNDAQDYQIFVSYLQDYLSLPADPEAAKKVFSIKGHTFRGTPHQPKNYFNKVELVAYGLMPRHFHLLVHQKTRDSLEGFIRSLCTRYSMYFNKKYQRAGSLFQGPYKSVLIKDETRLLHLTRYLHTGGYSSYPEYLGERVTSWVKPQAGNYKDFVEKYEPDQSEKEVLSETTLESENRHVERPRLKISELMALGGIFLLLLALGIRNVRTSTTPLVLSKTADVEVKKMLTIKITDEITDGSASVNIRQEPTVRANKIGVAKEGDVFEFVSLDSGWYEIKLTDGSTGFISARYIEVIPKTHN